MASSAFLQSPPTSSYNFSAGNGFAAPSSGYFVSVGSGGPTPSTQDIPQSSASAAQHPDISDQFYTPPVWVRMNRAAFIVRTASEMNEGIAAAKERQDSRLAERIADIRRIRDALANLKVYSSIAADPTASFNFGRPQKEQLPLKAIHGLATETIADEEKDPQSPLTVFGAEALLSCSARRHEVSFGDGSTAVIEGNGGIVPDAAFPSLGTADAAGEEGSTAESSATFDKDSLPTLSSPTESSPPQGAEDAPEAGVAQTQSPVADSCEFSTLTDLAADAARMARQCSVSICGALQFTDHLLGLLGAEYRAREDIISQEAHASGLGMRMSAAFITSMNGSGSSAPSSPISPYASLSTLGLPAGVGAHTLLAQHRRLLHRHRILGEFTRLGLNESQGRAAVDREYGTFIAWASQAEPEWRSGVQRLVDDRLSREAAAAAEARRVREAEEQRRLALEAMANEAAENEARRKSEMERLRAEELALAKRLHDRREAEMAAAAALKEKQEREERERKDEEYSRLLQAEEDLALRMQQRREQEEAAERARQLEADTAYALMLQQQAELADRLQKEEESIKARVAEAERARQIAKDERHAALLAAEEEARAAFEAKQLALAREKARKEEEEASMAAERERERERVRTEMIAAAKAEEERLRLAQLHRMMTSQPQQVQQTPVSASMPPYHNGVPHPHSQTYGVYPTMVGDQPYSHPYLSPQQTPSYSVQPQFSGVPQQAHFIPQPVQQGYAPQHGVGQPQGYALHQAPLPHPYPPQQLPPQPVAYHQQEFLSAVNRTYYDATSGQRLHYDPSNFAPLQ